MCSLVDMTDLFDSQTLLFNKMNEYYKEKQDQQYQQLCENVQQLCERNQQLRERNQSLREQLVNSLVDINPEQLEQIIKKNNDQMKERFNINQEFLNIL